MFNKTENSESPIKRTERKSTFFQKNNFNPLNYYSNTWWMIAFILGCCMLVAFKGNSAEEPSIVITASPALPARNLITNPGFENPIDKGAFWSNRNFWRGKGKAEVAEDQAHSGKKSFRFTGLSKDAKGQCSTQPFRIHTDIPYLLDFYVMCNLGVTGSVMVLHQLDNPEIVPDRALVSLKELAEKPDQWISFLSPPKDISTERSIILFPPRRKEIRRHCRMIRGKTLLFSRKEFNNQKTIKVYFYILSSGMGITWFDDIVLKPLKTRLSYKVKGKGIARITITNDKGKTLQDKQFLEKSQKQCAGTLLVPANAIYTLKVVLTNGKNFIRRYPEPILTDSGKQ